jgi:hypothetical protein
LTSTNDLRSSAEGGNFFFQRSGKGLETREFLT